MDALDGLTRWLDIRPGEARSVALASAGAFLVIAFMVLARSLREALYLEAFPVETLPYITASTAVMSVPTVAVFARRLSRRPPRIVLGHAVIVLAAGLALLWPVGTRSGAAVVVFYLWTALGTLILTSGFWVVIAEHFPVRGAKRLFALIGAGGTAGALVMGNGLLWLAGRLELTWLLPLLVLLLVLFAATQRMLPAPTGSTVAGYDDGSAATSMREGLRAAWENRHLRTLALIVFVSSMASTILDYQFKDLAQASLETGPRLAGFFGGFYGWTGGLSLAVQLLLATRIMTSAGLGGALAMLPVALVLGSTGLLVAPGLVLATLARGADNTLRRSVHRSVLEVLYVPLPAVLRRKTKTFIDSVVDSLAEGLGAAVIFLWVTLAGLPMRWLSLPVILLSAAFLHLSRRMDRHYLRTVVERLQEGEDEARRLAADLRPAGRDLISGTFTDLGMSLSADAVSGGGGRSARAAAPGGAVGPRKGTTGLEAAETATVLRTVRETVSWQDREIPVLARLLARDAVFPYAAEALARLGDRAVPVLAEWLRDESTDFVIRRRIPRILARAGGPEADAALLDALSAGRFEVRYWAALALVRRRRQGLSRARRDVPSIVWRAVRAEVGRDRPVWELQRVLDEHESADDRLVAQRVDLRGALSLEHTFRLLTLVLEPEAVRAAFHGVVLDDERLRSFALEYLERVLPDDIRRRLWPFIGDVSDRERARARRPLDQVVADLIDTNATLFGSEEDQAALRRLVRGEGPGGEE